MVMDPVGGLVSGTMPVPVTSNMTVLSFTALEGIVTVAAYEGPAAGANRITRFTLAPDSIEVPERLWTLNPSASLEGSTAGVPRSRVPVLYRLNQGKPEVQPVRFDPTYADKLYFVFLNRKQISRESIAKYRSLHIEKSPLDAISHITRSVLECTTLEEFEEQLREHEQLIAGILGLKPIQDQHFSDYFGQTKSLGAWGGDFLLATGNEDTPAYFSGKGFKTVIPFAEMVLP